MKKRNLIFLDFDGVLNDPKWLVDNGRACHAAKIPEFDVNRVNVLAAICYYTKAKLVLSSSWDMREGLLYYFKKQGFKVVGRLGYHGNRGVAINKWLQKHPWYRKYNYVILDDERSDYIGKMANHLVFTGSDKHRLWTKETLKFAPKEVGLNISHVKEVINKLEGDHVI